MPPFAPLTSLPPAASPRWRRAVMRRSSRRQDKRQHARDKASARATAAELRERREVQVQEQRLRAEVKKFGPRPTPAMEGRPPEGVAFGEWDRRESVLAGVDAEMQRRGLGSLLRAQSETGAKFIRFDRRMKARPFAAYLPSDADASVESYQSFATLFEACVAVRELMGAEEERREAAVDQRGDDLSDWQAAEAADKEHVDLSRFKRLVVKLAAAST